VSRIGKKSKTVNEDILHNIMYTLL